MLQHLYIRNYALIKELDISFGPGFSVITGETGAGKSILLGAINMILGHRTDMKALKDSNEKCVVEATFNLDGFDLKDVFYGNELDYDDECIIRREISPSGKSRAFINDTPVQLTVLKEIGSRLMDIHSQHQNLLINNTSFIVNFVDALSGNEKLVAEYRNSFTEYCKTKKKYDEFVSLSDKAKGEEEYFRFQLSQIEDARLLEDEQEKLEEESKMLNHSEEIKSGLFSIGELFDMEDNGVIASMKRQIQTARSIQGVYPQAEDIANRIESAYIDMKDLSYEVSGYAEDVNFDPERFSYVNERLNLIYSLEQRFHVDSISELLKLASEIHEKLDAVEKHDELLKELSDNVANAYGRAFDIARKLSERRKEASSEIQEELEKVLRNLGMPDVKITITDNVTDSLSVDGIDSIRMMFSANKNRGMQDVSDIASGGEIARVMLAVKFLICKVKVLPTIFFDEIDTGVSGDIAARMGNIMKDMGKNMQVISITHLPQIAAKGTNQYKVYKDNNLDDKTTTNIRLLNKEERIKEVATMLSGSSVTEAAINNAKELLNND